MIPFCAALLLAMGEMDVQEPRRRTMDVQEPRRRTSASRALLSDLITPSTRSRLVVRGAIDTVVVSNDSESACMRCGRTGLETVALKAVSGGEAKEQFVEFGQEGGRSQRQLGPRSVGGRTGLTPVELGPPALLNVGRAGDRLLLGVGRVGHGLLLVVQVAVPDRRPLATPIAERAAHAAAARKGREAGVRGDQVSSCERRANDFD